MADKENSVSGAEHVDAKFTPTAPSGNRSSFTGSPRRDNIAGERRTVEDIQPVGVGISPFQLQEIFPFHVAIDNQMKIVQVGIKLFAMLGGSHILGSSIGQIFKIANIKDSKWDWNFLKSIAISTLHVELIDTKLLSVGRDIRATAFTLSGQIYFTASGTSPTGLLLLSPSLSSLEPFGIKDSDLPIHSFQADLIEAGAVFC
jgi:hypothetical protein